jgi:RHS repeat-associated protein
MQAGVSTMEVRVIHGGNLAAKELYVYQGQITNFALIDRVIYERDCLGHATNVLRIDPSTEQARVIYKADWQGPNQWPIDLRFSETDEGGIVVTNFYDSLKRLKTATKLAVTGQSAIVTNFVCDAAGRVLTNTVSAGQLSQTMIARYDLAGRLTNSISPQGFSTIYSFADGGRQTTITHPSGTTEVIAKYLDRRLKSITGNAITNQFFDYSLAVDAIGDCVTLTAKNITKVTLGSTNSLRWSATLTDKRYQPVAEWKPGFGSTNVLYKCKDFRVSQTGLPKGIWESGVEPGSGNQFYTILRYNAHGDPTLEIRNGPESNTPIGDLDTTDRANSYTNFYAQDGQGHWFHVSEQWTYPYDNDATPALVERTKERLTGFASTQVSEQQKFDADTNQTTIKISVDLANKKLTITTAVPQSSLTATQIVVNGLLQTESTSTVSAPTTHYYDSLGRGIAVKDPLGFITGTRYDTATGQVIATTNAQSQVTSFEYYPADATNAGLLKCQTDPTGKKTYQNYNGRGQVTYVWGDVLYPERREYDDFGDLVSLSTYRGGSQWTGSTWPPSPGTNDVTQWFYDQATGLLTNKTDAANQSVTFDYYHNHYLKTKRWARGVMSTNLYSLNGDLVRIDYSDSTPSVLFANETYPYLNRRAQPVVTDDASGTWTNNYDHAGRVIASKCTGGLLSSITVSNHFNAVYGRDALSAQYSSTPLLQHSFVHDTYGRLAVISNGTYSATYGYLANSDLLQTTTCKSNTLAILTTTRTWEYGSRLASIVNTVNGATVISHSYQYDALNRRRQSALEDYSVWNYDYDDRNELTGARRYWLADWSPVAGQQFAYDYDNIGNRKTASSGGDTNGANLRTNSYTANNLNEYTAVSTPGYKDIIGVALATNSVTVNGGTADRKAEYFHREIPIGNGSGPLWTNMTVSSGGVTNMGGCVFPDDNQTLTYDADGNLTFDGVWAYEWDAENRLKTMTMTNVASIANSNRLRLEFAYDYTSRRVQKKVSAWNASAFVAQSTNRFVYDGWNLLAILNPQSSVFQSFLWGNDLGGTLSKAGGVGGLLAVFDQSSINNQPSTHFVCYDGNGNIGALINVALQTISARYEYGSFGEILRATGPMGKANSFRFSTKYVDDESALVYYGYRYYSPTLGRWINRDPAEEEKGGNNLFRFCGNNSLSNIDTDGRIMINPAGSVEFWYQKMIEAYENIEISKLFKDVKSWQQALLDYKWAKIQLNRAAASTAARVGGQFGARWGLGRVAGFVLPRLLGSMGAVAGGVGIGLAAGFIFAYVVDQAAEAVGAKIAAVQKANERAVDYYASTGIKWLDD